MICANPTSATPAPIEPERSVSEMPSARPSGRGAFQSHICATVSKHFLALAFIAGEIGGQAAIIIARGPKDVVVNLVEQRVGTGEVADLRHGIANHFAFDRVQSWFAGKSGDLDVAKAVLGNGIFYMQKDSVAVRRLAV